MRRHSLKASPLADARRSRTATDEAAEAISSTPVEPARALADSVVATADENISAGQSTAFVHDVHAPAAEATHGRRCPPAEGWGPTDMAELVAESESKNRTTATPARTRAGAREAALAAQAPE